MSSDAVLLVSFGGPEKFEDVRPFLENVVKGHAVPRSRIETVVEQYRAIGGSSPLNKITFGQAHALEKLLHSSLPQKKIVYVGMRNWTPTILEALEQMSSHGVNRALALILAPHRCEASYQRYQVSIEDALKKMGGDALRIVYPASWHTHPLLIEAFCQCIVESTPERSKGEDHWIFSAHSIPVSMDKESGYSRQVQETAGLIAERFGKKNWSVSYQSRSGRPEDPWLEPDIGEKIRELSRKGVGRVFVIPVGFLSDHVEVLYDLDIKAKKEASACDVDFVRCRGLNDHPKFIEMLAQIAIDSLT